MLEFFRTGVGALLVAAFIGSMPACAVSVSPADDFIVRGFTGGPISGNKSYTISPGVIPCGTGIDWSVSSTQPWVSLSLTDGFVGTTIDTCSPETETTIVSINVSANTLPVGVHTAIITFGSSGGVSGLATRTVSLTIQNPVIISCSSTQAQPNPACVDLFVNTLAAGNSVHVIDGVEIDLTGRTGISIGGSHVIEGTKENHGAVVSLTGTRSAANRGPRLYTTSRPKPLFTVTADNVRISGLRIHGADIGKSASTTPVGLLIDAGAAINVEVNDNEFAGWSGSAISVTDCGGDLTIPAGCTLRSSFLAPAATIHHNVIRENRHAGGFGYGVVVGHGAYARIDKNVFDYNRHAIAADGSMLSGYIATSNLVLRGSGETGFQKASHPFDIHGTGDNGFGGIAGEKFQFFNNAFQFFAERRLPPGVNIPSINIRGTPTTSIQISGNVFVHEAAKDDGIEQTTTPAHYRFSDWTRISIGANRTNIQTFGKYHRCDLDGDGTDDLVLFSGTGVWYSPGGRVAWRHWSSLTQLPHEVMLGQFNGGPRCDAMRVVGGSAMIATNAKGLWRLAGRVDRAVKDLRPFHRAGSSRTAVFRVVGRQWQYRFLTGVNTAWHNLESSTLGLSSFRFGDFDGDGNTDVLAVVGGDWSVSRAGTSKWATLNTRGTGVDRLIIGDFNGDGRDDIAEFQINCDTTVPISCRLARLSYASAGQGAMQPLSVAGLQPISVNGSPAILMAGAFASPSRSHLLVLDTAREGKLIGVGLTSARRWSEAPY